MAGHPTPDTPLDRYRDWNNEARRLLAVRDAELVGARAALRVEGEISNGLRAEVAQLRAAFVDVGLAPIDNLPDECQGLTTNTDRPTCLHVLANLLRRNGVVQISARSGCPACRAALSAVLAPLGVDWPADPAPVAAWTYDREPEPDSGDFDRSVVRDNLAPGEKP